MPPSSGSADQVAPGHSRATACRALGRVHNRAQAIAAVEEAQRNFETFNLDLMYALPGQSSDDLDADIQQALAFEPPHLSLYHLTLEPNTRFATQPPKGLPDEDTAFDMLDHLIERTTAAGLQKQTPSSPPNYPTWSKKFSRAL